jgi:phage-related protein
MVIWEKIFYPPAGEKHSPVDVLRISVPVNVQALIKRKLITLSELEIGDWPYWVKMVNKMYQVKANDYRVYFGLISKQMIICHICRKVGRKANPRDLERARRNFNDYIESIK